jgi:hypothetical protein
MKLFWSAANFLTNACAKTESGSISSEFFRERMTKRKSFSNVKIRDLEWTEHNPCSNRFKAMLSIISTTLREPVVQVIFRTLD